MRRNFHFHFATGLTAILLLFYTHSIAQEDSSDVGQGTVHVGKDSVKAIYFVFTAYDFARDAGKEAWWLAPAFMTVGPYPDTLQHPEKGKRTAAQDSLYLLQYVRTHPRPADTIFNWTGFFNAHCGFYFSPDEMPFDSALIEIDVSPRGHAQARFIPWTAADSSSRLGQTALQTVQPLWRWYPPVAGNLKQEKMFVPCTVVLLVYASDQNAYRKRFPATR